MPSFVSFIQALVKDGYGNANLAIAWQYPGQELEVIPANYSVMTRPGWPVTCAKDSDCDDGVWCNGKLCYLGCISHFQVCGTLNSY